MEHMFVFTNLYKLFSILENSAQNNSALTGFKPEYKVFQGGLPANDMLPDHKWGIQIDLCLINGVTAAFTCEYKSMIFSFPACTNDVFTCIHVSHVFWSDVISF